MNDSIPFKVAIQAGFLMASVIGILLFVPFMLLWAVVKLWPFTLAFLVIWVLLAVFYYWEDRQPKPSPFEGRWDE